MAHSAIAELHNVQHTSSGQRLILGLNGPIHLIKSLPILWFWGSEMQPHYHPYEEMLRVILPYVDARDIRDQGAWQARTQRLLAQLPVQAGPYLRTGHTL